MARKIRRWVNILIMIIVLVPVIVIGGLFAAVSLIDFNNYKSEIEQEVLAKTGHQLTIDGDINVSVIPFKFSLGESRLLQPEKFGSDQPLLSFEKLNLRLSLMDLLLKQKAHLLGVELISPRLDLQVNKEGERSWSKFLAVKQEVNHQSNTGFVKVSLDSQALNQSVNWAKNWQLKLNSLTIHDGELAWQSFALNEHYEIRHIQLMAFNVQLDEFFTFQSQGRLVDVKRQQHTQFDIRSQLKLADHSDLIELQQLKSDLQFGEGEELNDQDLTLSLNLQNLLWQRKSANLSLTGAHFKSKDDELGFNLAADLSNRNWSGDVNISQINLRKWLDIFDIRYPQFTSPEALSKLRGELDWAFNANQWEVQNLNMTLDKTKLQGQINMQHQPKVVQFDVQLGELNVDDYQAQIEVSSEPETDLKTEQQESKVPPKTAKTDKTQSQKTDIMETQLYLPVGIPVNHLREVQAQGTLKVDALQILGVQYQNIQTELSSQYGVLDMAPLDFEMYGGTFQSRFSIDVNGDTPAYALKGQMNAVNSQLWLTDMLEFNQLVGNLSSRFDLTTAGSNLDAVKYNLNGRFSVQLDHGAYLAMDLNKLLAGETSHVGDATAINNAQIAGELVNGVYFLQNSKLESERFNAELLGKVNIAQATLDNELGLLYHTPPPGLVVLKNVLVPVKVTGAMAKPDWQVNLDKLLSPANINKLLQLFN